MIKHLLTLAGLAVAGIACDAEAQPTPQAWQASVTTDKLTDEKKCVVKSGKTPGVWVESTGALVVNLNDTAGAGVWAYRIDNHPAAQWQQRHPGDGNTIRVADLYNEFPTAKRVLIQVETRAGKNLELDLSMAGFEKARQAMLKRCGIPDPYPLSTAQRE